MKISVNTSTWPLWLLIPMILGSLAIIALSIMASLGVATFGIDYLTRWLFGVTIFGAA